jgi:NAD(P)-dependent dehydrogenase (short-subunit alcohol dehydrogenase family)
MAGNPMDLAGCTILITGASSGIGRECAVCFSQMRARLVLAGRDRERLEETRDALEGEGHAVEPYDLNALDGIAPWVKGIASRHGQLHGLVHSAGVYGLTPLRGLAASSVEAILRVNLSAAILLAGGLRQRGCHADGASLVFISSVAALRGHAGLAAYSASKSALLGLTKSLAVELARDGIRVNAVAPGLVATKMAAQVEEQTPGAADSAGAGYPLGPGFPQDVANGIAFLLSGAARWITGSTLVIDGGYSAQ